MSRVHCLSFFQGRAFKKGSFTTDLRKLPERIQLFYNLGLNGGGYIRGGL